MFLYIEELPIGKPYRREAVQLLDKLIVPRFFPFHQSYTSAVQVFFLVTVHHRKIELSFLARHNLTSVQVGNTLIKVVTFLLRKRFESYVRREAEKSDSLSCHRTPP
jgi:hypothetical protein